MLVFYVHISFIIMLIANFRKIQTGNLIIYRFKAYIIMDMKSICRLNFYFFAFQLRSDCVLKMGMN